MPSLLIIGANGQLGQAMQHTGHRYPQWRLWAVDAATCDITDAEAIARTLAYYQPDYVINCAAYTAVDRAETEQERAFLVNFNGPQQLALACAARGSHLFHFSTDYVYGGTANQPIKETDATQPVGVYATTKLAGEQAVMAALPTATIIRTSWVYAARGHNFVNTMLRLGAERAELGVVYDQVGTPTWAADLATAVATMIDRVTSGSVTYDRLAGIYHYSNEGVTSWYDFALAIFELSGLTSCQVQPIESQDYPTPAPRPPYSVLSKDKLKANFGLAIPHWRVSLAQCLRERSALQANPHG